MPADSHPVLRKIETSPAFDWPKIGLFFGILIASAVGFGYVWSGHFSSSFHLDDAGAIVNNRSIRTLSDIGHTLKDPRAFSANPSAAFYAPLLTSWFALDYRLAGGRADPLLFQIENFVWFVMELLLIYLVTRLIPWTESKRGAGHYTALFTALLYGLHPLSAETVNYALKRGEIIAGVSVLAGLALWIVWPRRLPEDFLIGVPKVPKTDWDAFKKDIQPRISAAYRAVRNFPFPLYLVPVVLGMLISPAAAAFAPIVLAWALLFERDRSARVTIPALVVCEGYWIFQSVWSWRAAASQNLPQFGFWIAQPWAIVHYFYAFFIPVHIWSVSNLQPFASPWTPLALAGFAGLAVLIVAAVFTARSTEWRGVSFGLWWFLAASAQQALVPQMTVEAFPRAFVGYIGLTFAVVACIRVLTDRQVSAKQVSATHVGAPGDGDSFQPSLLIVPTLLIVILAGLGWQTWRRNQVWQTDQTLWTDILEKNPNDGFALMNYGLVLMNMPGDDLYNLRHQEGRESLVKAEKLLPNDATVVTNVAVADEYFGLDSDAESHYQRAVTLRPNYARAWSLYAGWLLKQGKKDKSREAALKAEHLDPNDLMARHTLADGYLAENNWTAARENAVAALAIAPGDEDATRELNVADAGLKVISDAATTAKNDPTVNNYLSLALLYFRSGMYEDSIRADRQALTLRPDIVEAWLNIATTYYAMNRLDDTIEALREAEKLRPNMPLIKHDLDAALAQKTSLNR